MDKFPEAFRRFESAVNIDSIHSFDKLHSAFRLWSGRRWKESPRQKEALAIEARERGFEVPLDFYGGAGKKLRVHEEPEKVVARGRRAREGVRIRGDKIYFVRSEVREGKSANQIQRDLKQQGMGMKRQVLLRYVREAKGQPLKAEPSKYTPTKYRKK
jgi:hypothetical protein